MPMAPLHCVPLRRVWLRLFILYYQLFMYIDKNPAKPSLFQTEQSQLSQPLSMLDGLNL